MHRYAVTVLCLLGAVAAAPALARQRPDSTPATRVDTARAASPAAPPAGPRIESRWQSFRPRLETRATPGMPLQEGRMHTFRLSTLALILIGVIVLLLIVR